MSRMYDDRAWLYDLIYHWKNYAAEADHLRALLAARGVADGARVLEVACGTGSYLTQLARHYQVEGCDLNEGMAAVARQKLPEVPIWTVDMRELRVPAPFDAVLCLFSSIGYLLDEAGVRQAIAAMAAAVRPGGVLIVEPWIDAAIYDVGRPIVQIYDTPDLKLVRATVSQRRDDIAVTDMHWMVVPRGGPIEQFSDLHELWFCPPEVMRRAFVDAGLSVAFLEGGLGTGRGLWIGQR